jgi:ABC-type antimicrobial peptide transport system permease subunit
MLRQSVWSVDENQPIGRIETMQDVSAENEGGDKLMIALMGIFAALALVLAAVGIYGIVAHTVSQRTREIGIRMALGAEKKDVLRLVLRQGGRLAGIGCAVGLALALPLPRLFTGMFEGFPSQGPLVALVATSLIAVVSLVATYIPARRATRVDPMVSLRHE